MYSVSSATVQPGKTVLALLAIFSLLLSSFAVVVQPVLADHGATHLKDSQQNTSWDDDVFNKGNCEAEDLARITDGEVLWHFVLAPAGDTLPGNADLTAEFENVGQLTVASEGNSAALHFYVITEDSDTLLDAWVDVDVGMLVLSHVCDKVGDENGEQPEDEGGILIEKVDEEDDPLAGGVFTVEGKAGEFTTGADGRVCVDGLPLGATLTVTEIQAPAGYQIANPASLEVEVDDDGCDSSPEVTFINELDEQPEEMVEVEIMKHLCADVSTVEQFEAIENEARMDAENNEELDENPDFAALAATVVACPTIILSANVSMDESPDAQVGEFDFTVLDANGIQVLSTDGLFVDDKLCETDIMVDVNNNGSFDAEVCLDTSYYRFEVEDGIVTITETDAPGDESFFGTIRFTPGSGDEMALVGSIPEVEASGGVITLDTTLDPDNSGEATPDEYADDLIMVHVYNFTAAEGTEGGNPPGGGGTSPDTAETPRDGTQGGNPLPDTATSPIPGGSVPAALLALAMLSGLGAAGYAMATEARRRR